MRESTNPKVHQYLCCYIQAKDGDYYEVTPELEKSFSTQVLLEDPADDALDIVNKLLKKTKEQNQVELAISTLSIQDNSLRLKGPCWKVRHNYKQLNSKDFVKAAKPIQKVIQPKTYKEALAGLYFKEWQQAMKEKYDNQIKREIYYSSLWL